MMSARIVKMYCPNIQNLFQSLENKFVNFEDKIKALNKELSFVNKRVDDFKYQ